MKTSGFIRGAKHVELSFEEEIDVENVYRDNSVLDQNTFQQARKGKKGHRRQPSEFEEEGRENLSAEGDECLNLESKKLPEMQGI